MRSMGAAFSGFESSFAEAHLEQEFEGLRLQCLGVSGFWAGVEASGLGV